MDTQLDPSVVALTKAIGQTESGGDYTAKGKSEEYGAYQYTPATWAADSAKYLGYSTDLYSATPEQQDKVAYMKVQDLGKQGYKPAQIASIWNSGKPDWEGNVGTNSFGVAYDTPSYVKKVANAYETQQKGFNPKPYSNGVGAIDVTGTEQGSSQGSTPDTSLGGEISGRINDVSNAISDTTSGKQNIVSGILQTGGAIAGSLGDVVNKSIELIPGVKALEGVIGDKVNQLAKTQGGQAIVKSLQDFSTQHPELSKDIGASFNIITALPILKGLGVVKDIALDGLSNTVKNVAEKTAIKGLSDVVGSRVTGRKALEMAPEAIQTLVKERAIPDIVNDHYVTENAYHQLGNEISTIEDHELQPTLAKVSTTAVADRQSLDALHKEALALISQEMKGTGESEAARAEINRKFASFKADYGDYVTLQDVNDMKRGVRTSVNFNSPKLAQDTTYHLGQVFQKNIEDQATKLGLGDVHKINQKMARLIKAQNMLQHIEGKPVKLGILGSVIKNAATAGGEMAGNATGIPIAGALVGRGLGGSLGKKLTGGVEGVLKRTGKNAVKTSVGKSLKKIGGLIAGASAQKVTQPR